ncbi:hypothetical protein HHK36_021082 [Tetracentron sinense]|uniref:Uncharacterized protein n=1 Tax=Tetracentron sinense TaxID=13715 RepID=A0A834YUG1_TETSI|nr:hypothetical protein HHK36_021082 [Tetracentron sinense]
MQVSWTKPVLVTVVYGSNLPSEREALWHGLSRIAGRISMAWMVLGDLNSIVFPSEKLGGNHVPQRLLEPLQNSLTASNLSDLKWKGALFSWTNGRIAEVWESQWHGTAMFKLQCKLKAIRRALIDWSNTTFGKVQRWTAEARTCVEEVQTRMNSDPSNAAIHKEYACAKKNLSHLLQWEEAKLWQCSRVNWLHDLARKVHDGAIIPHPACKQPLITHLCFVDDLIIISDAAIGSIISIKSSLECFKKASMDMNMSKPQVFFGNVNANTTQSIEQILGLRRGSLPIKYLGINFSSSLTIYASPDSVMVVDINAPAARIALHKWQPNKPDGQGTSFLFRHGKTIASSTRGAFMRMFKRPVGPGFEEWHFPQALAFASSGIRSSTVVSVTCDREIITVILRRIHRASASHSSNISEPSTTSGMPTSTNSGSFANVMGDNSRSRRIECPLHVLRGHLREISCCYVSSDLGIIVSCSHSSDVLLHSIRRGRARVSFTGSINCIEVSVNGESALIGTSLCVEENDSASGNNKDLELNKHEGEDLSLVTDDNNANEWVVPVPSICFLDMHTLKVFHALKLGERQDITALALNKDNTNLMVSTADSLH